MIDFILGLLFIMVLSALVVPCSILLGYYLGLKLLEFTTFVFSKKEDEDNE